MDQPPAGVALDPSLFLGELDRTVSVETKRRVAGCNLWRWLLPEPPRVGWPGGIPSLFGWGLWT